MRFARNEAEAPWIHSRAVGWNKELWIGAKRACPCMSMLRLLHRLFAGLSVRPLDVVCSRVAGALSSVFLD